MSTVPEADARIEALAAQEYETPGAALAAVTEATAIINNQIKAEQERSPGTESFAGDFGDRLRRLLEKLEAMLKKIAKQFAAMSYSITVSWQMGVSVTVTWTPGS